MAGNLFLQLKDIKGESQHVDHKEWIDVESWSWSMSRDGTFHKGGGGSGGTAYVQDMSFTKQLDMATPDLQKQCLNGKHIGEATFHVIKEGEKALTVVEVKLKDVIIANVSMSGSSGLPMESVTLNFREVHYKYVGQEDTGAGGTSPEYKWDIVTGAEA
jgi:type VI secretion system secreted protein Hcp